MRNIYLDHAATTPLDQRVLEAMKPLLTETFGNPSSSHFFGRKSRAVIDSARDVLASALGALPSEIYFTSGGTEADNLAITGCAEANSSRGRHIITQATEHHAVLDPCRRLESKGFRVTYLPVDQYGLVDPSDLLNALSDDTVLVSIMYANNEVGTIQPIEELARIAHERGALFHTDAVQAFGQLPLDVRNMGLDMVSVSAHKIYGPKGTGALYVRRGINIEPLMYGGGQERERRPGTENPAGIAGFAEAVRIALETREDTTDRISRLRDRFITSVIERIDGVALNGHPRMRLPGNANLSFAGADSESLIVALDLEGIAVSGGSACTAGSLEPSHVLIAMGLPAERTRSAVRFSLGRGTTEEELDYTVDVLEKTVHTDGDGAQV